MIAQLAVVVVLPALLVAAAAFDLTSFTIPNPIQIALIALFAVFALASHMDASAFGGHLLSGFIGLVAGFSLFALGYVGGGDAKLFAGIGLWLGFSDLLPYAVVASVCGGILTLGLLTFRNVPLPAFLEGKGWIVRLHDNRAGVPYGIALAAGALVVLPQAEIFRASVTG